MSRKISFSGQTFVVPDDATDDEITQIAAPSASLPNATSAPPGTPTVKAPAFMGGHVKSGSSAGQSPLIANTPTEEGAGESFLNAASPAGAEGRPSDIYNGPKQLITHPLDSLKMLSNAYNDQSTSELNQAKDALANKDYIRAGVHGVGYALPFVGPLIAKAGEQANAHNFAGAAGTTAGVALPFVAGEVGPRGIETLKRAADRFSRTPINDITSDTYSKPGSQVSASLRSNARVDVPAEAHVAIPAIKEGLADRGFTARDFNGRNGPAVFQAGVDNALDIQEARAKSAIDPIRGEKVDPQILAQNPELASRFEGKQNITYGDLDAERIKDPCSGIRQHGHRVRNHRSFARAHPGRVKCNNSSVLKRVGEIRPALHRARHAVEQQHRITGSGGPRRNA